jgi:Kef-type K+ transport system membrane component KefB
VIRLAIVRHRFVVYLLILASSVAAIAGLIHFGSGLFPASTAVALPAATTGSVVVAGILDNVGHPLARLLLQLVVIVVLARVCGSLAERLGQPAVIGEIAAGVLLGPSLLGWLAPLVSATLFPPASMPILQLLSQIGVLLFMFVVGLEMEPSYLRGKAQAAVAVSHFSIVIPFILGVMLSLGLFSRYAAPGAPFHVFALFCGIAMSITAFPVLARILAERQLTHTPLGTTAIACAAVDDVTAWSVLAFVVAITTAGSAVETLEAMMALSALFVGLMIGVARPVLHRVLKPAAIGDTFSKARMAIVLAVLLASALVTEAIGIHALFGAFVAGAVMPSGGAFRRMLHDRLESLSSVFLLPIFFVYTGLRTEAGLLDDWTSWAICAAIVVVATAGKLGGTALAARWMGMAWRDSVALGALMNTRGMMELIALNVGYDLGILSPEIFAMMVLMALVTTAMTGPLLSMTLTPEWRRGLVLQTPGGGAQHGRIGDADRIDVHVQRS